MDNCIVFFRKAGPKFGVGDATDDDVVERMRLKDSGTGFGMNPAGYLVTLLEESHCQGQSDVAATDDQDSGGHGNGLLLRVEHDHQCLWLGENAHIYM